MFNQKSEIPKGYIAIFKSKFLAHLSSKSTYSGFNQISARWFPNLGNDFIPYETLFELMIKEFTHLEDPSQRIISCSLELVLIQLIRIDNRMDNSNYSTQQRIIRDFKKLVSENISDKHLVKDYAKVLNLTPKYLTKVLKAETGKTAKEIIAESLILEAQRKLIYTSQTASEIAYSLGFNSSSHFIKYFKTWAGYTPKQFRIDKVTDISP